MSGKARELAERVLKCREKRTMTKRLRVCEVAAAITCARKWGMDRFGRVANSSALFTVSGEVGKVAMMSSHTVWFLVCSLCVTHGC